MEQWNLSDSMMNEEISVQLVFPMLQIQRFAKTVRCASMKHCVHDIIQMDDLLKEVMEQNFLVFDRKGRRMDPNLSFACFGEAEWIQLFII
ncbi:MAG: hypothetical protein IJC38_07100 [Erysipelotrichaceae bacterium]|nr:hypothetical protein [Erysipelotrichaceae bacterium]